MIINLIVNDLTPKAKRKVILSLKYTIIDSSTRS